MVGRRSRSALKLDPRLYCSCIGDRFVVTFTNRFRICLSCGLAPGVLWIYPSEGD